MQMNENILIRFLKKCLHNYEELLQIKIILGSHLYVQFCTIL